MVGRSSEEKMLREIEAGWKLGKRQGVWSVLHPAHMILQLQLCRSWVYTLLGCREEADEVDLAQVEQV